MGLKDLFYSIFGAPPTNVSVIGKKQAKALPLADKDLCQNCGVRSAWKTLRASLIFKDDGETKKVLNHMDLLEDKYKFTVE